MSHRSVRLTHALVAVLLAGFFSGGMPAAAQDVSAVHQRDITLDGTPVAISPDGKRIAGLGADGTFCVWRISTKHATCSDAIAAITPDTIRWAPDSSAVAFSQNAAIDFVDSDIYVFDVASGKVNDITDDSYDGNLSFDTDKATKATINVDINPSWSPDGKDLIFARTVWGSATGMGSQLMKVSRDGGDPTTLFTVAPPEPLVLWGQSAWLPDGSILFPVSHTDAANEQNGIWKLGPSGGVTQLVKGGEKAKVPLAAISSISPDGRYAAVYSRALVGQYATDPDVPTYWLLDLSDGSLTALQNGSPQDGDMIIAPPAFAAAGDLVVYAESGTSGGPNLAVRTIGSILDGDDHVSRIPIGQEIAPTVASNGFTITSKGTVLIASGSGDDGDSDSQPSLLLTLDIPDDAPTPTPVAPCSCTPPASPAA